MEKLLMARDKQALTRKNYDVRDWAVPLGGVREARSLAFGNPSDTPERGWLGTAGMYFSWAPGSPKPQRLKAGTRDVLLQAACGERHSLLLFSNHRVYSCGDNSWGQLGQRREQSTEQPGDYQPPEHVLRTRCGSLGSRRDQGTREGAQGYRVAGPGIPVGWSRDI